MPQYVITSLNGRGVGDVLGTVETVSPEDAMNKVAKEWFGTAILRHLETPRSRARAVRDNLVGDEMRIRIFETINDEYGNPTSLGFDDLEFED